MDNSSITLVNVPQRVLTEAENAKLAAFQRETANQALEDMSVDIMPIGLAGLGSAAVTHGLVKAVEAVPRVIVPAQYANDRLYNGLASLANMRR